MNTIVYISFKSAEVRRLTMYELVVLIPHIAPMSCQHQSLSLKIQILYAKLASLMGLLFLTLTVWWEIQSIPPKFLPTLSQKIAQ